MLRNVLFVRKFVEKAHESSFPLGNEIQVAQPLRGGPRGTKWGLHNLYFDWASSSRATDNVGYIAVQEVGLTQRSPTCRGRGSIYRQGSGEGGSKRISTYPVQVRHTLAWMFGENIWVWDRPYII